MTFSRRTAVAAVLATIGLAAAGCGSSSKSASPVPSSSAAPASQASATPASHGASSAVTAGSAVVVIKNFAYRVPASVPAGAKITVRDEDPTSHTITDKGGAFDVNVPGSGSATFTAPSKPGRYTLYCKYHSNMHGVLVVS